MTGEQLGEHRQGIIALDLALNMDRQAFPAVLVDHRQHPERLAVVRAVGDEVVAPHMAAMLRPQPHARSIIEPETVTFRLFLWDIQPLTTPDAFDPLGIYRPTLTLQQRGDPTIARATIGRRQPDDIRRQALLIRSKLARLALGRTVLANDPACTTPSVVTLLRDAQRAADRADLLAL